MEEAMNQRLAGLYNLVNNTPISKYDLLSLFNASFKAGGVSISPSEELRVDKSLQNTRTDFDFEVPSYEVMVREMKEWIDDHKELYPHYFATGESAGGER